MGEANKREEREAAEERANHEELVREAVSILEETATSVDVSIAVSTRVETIATVAAILAVRDAVLDLPDVYLERVEELAREAAAAAPRHSPPLTSLKPR